MRAGLKCRPNAKRLAANLPFAELKFHCKWEVHGWVKRINIKKNASTVTQVKAILWVSVARGTWSGQSCANKKINTRKNGAWAFVRSVYWHEGFSSAQCQIWSAQIAAHVVGVAVGGDCMCLFINPSIRPGVSFFSPVRWWLTRESGATVDGNLIADSWSSDSLFSWRLFSPFTTFFKSPLVSTFSSTSFAQAWSGTSCGNVTCRALRTSVMSSCFTSPTSSRASSLSRQFALSWERSSSKCRFFTFTITFPPSFSVILAWHEWEVSRVKRIRFGRGIDVNLLSAGMLMMIYTLNMIVHSIMYRWGLRGDEEVTRILLQIDRESKHVLRNFCFTKTCNKSIRSQNVKFVSRFQVNFFARQQWNFLRKYLWIINNSTLWKFRHIS